MMQTPTAQVAAPLDETLLNARRLCYRALALCLMDPRAGTTPALRDPAAAQLFRRAAAVLRDESRARNSDLGPGERPLEDLDPELLLARLPAAWDGWNAAFERIFGLLAVGACPPYESEYVPGKFTFQRSNALADVAGFYRAFGLQPSSTHPDRPDHIVLQLEFMATLQGLELAAAGESEPAMATEHAEACRSAQRRFLGEHLAWWTPTFAALLQQEDAGGFYAAVGGFLAAFIAVERALLQVDRPHGRVEPDPIERPDDCSGCTVADL